MSVLVPHTKSTSASVGHDEAESLYRTQRNARYKLQETAAQMLPGHRVCACGWRPQPDSQIAISRRGSRHFVSGVAVCGSVWACPVCAAKIALERAAELERAVTEWQRVGGSVWLLTLTINHASPDSLHDLLKRFTAAMGELWAGGWAKRWRKLFSVRGIVRNLECTWGLANGWHPHAHGIIFTRSRLSKVAEKELKRRWCTVAARFGFRVSLERGCTLELANDPKAAAKYATKDDKGGTWGIAQELTWANIKKARGARFTPFALLAACDGSEVGAAPALFQEYVDAFKGRRQLYWSRGLRAELLPEPERTDEEIANAQDDETQFVCAVDTPIFCWIKARGLLPDLLDKADDMGYRGIMGFLEWAYDCRMYESRARKTAA